MYPEMQQIYWFSGVYLQPQHLQSVDLRNNYMLSRQHQLAQPWNTGIIKLDFNPETLLDFTLKIDHLQAILPSGEYLEFPGNCAIQPKQFREIWRQLEKPFTVWIALRRFDPGHVNVGDTANSRWLKPREERVMKDIYFNGPECSVSRIVYHLQLLSDEEKNASIDCEFLPLMRLRYENERVVCDPSFCPPLVTLSGYPTLRSLLDGLYAELANRAYQLAEYKRPYSLKEAAKVDIIQLLAMRSINRVLPVFAHYCRTPGMHPWPLYGLLAELIGDLSSFTQQCDFNGEGQFGKPLMHYDHFDLYRVFYSARQIIISLLNNLTLVNNTWVQLLPDDLRIFRGNLHGLPWEEVNTVLMMLSSESFIELKSVDSQRFKISAEPDIDAIIQHALPGIATNELNPAPPGVPQRPDAIYFELTRQNNFWKKVELQQNLAFYWAEAPGDLQVQIIFMGEN